MLVEKEDEISRLKGKAQNNPKKQDDEDLEVQLIEEEKQTSDQPDSGASKQEANLDNIQLQGILPPGLDKDYVRTTLLKYLEYMATGEEKEALTLEKVLFTVLEVSDDHRKKVEKARVDYNSGIMSYVYTNIPKTAKAIKPGKKRKTPVNFGLGAGSVQEAANVAPGQTMY